MMDLTHEFFTNHISTLKDTSFDGDHKSYMTESPRQVINFDKTADAYTTERHLSKLLASNDALFSAGNGKLVFVEFKNGRITKTVGFELRGKVYDSVLILSDLTASTLSEIREHVTYILVYNDEANHTTVWDPELVKKQTEVPRSKSFDSFAKMIGGFAREEYICFGLRAFQNYCFDKVHSYTKEEFESYLATLPPN